MNLTTEGTGDWVHWGGGAISPIVEHPASAGEQIGTVAMPGIDEKAGGEQISAVALLNGTTSVPISVPMGFSWTDGRPTMSASDMTTGLAMSGVGHGYQLTVPAGTAPRTLRLYVGVQQAQAQVMASLSDGSAPPSADTSLDSTGAGTALRVYTLTFAARSSGQTLNLTLSLLADHGGGSVDLLAATLQ